MRIDAATLALVLSMLAFTGVVWNISLDTEQGARLKRVEDYMRAQCDPNTPKHHLDACDVMAMPPAYPPSIFSPEPGE